MAKDIRDNGLHNPIWLMPDGAILDGKTRYEACGRAGVEPRFQPYTGDDPRKFTISQNAKRRHLGVGELSIVLAELSKVVPHGGDRGNRYTGGKSSKGLANPLLESIDKTAEELAKEAGIGRSNVVSARTVLEKGESNIVEMVRTNKVGAQSAAFFVRNTPREQQRAATVDQVRGCRDAHLPKGKKSHERKKIETLAISRDDFDKFRLLIKRVKEQSNRHAATVSFTELSIIAHELGELANAWMRSGEEPGTHSTPVPISRVHKGG